MDTLRKRAEFIAAAASAAQAPEPGFVLQVRRRGDDEPPRVGFTVSRKIGTAVERNRVRRRLRALVRRAPEGRMQAGHDYVLVGRRAALTLMFTRLMQDFVTALDDVHEGGEGARRPRSRRSAPAGEARGGRGRR